MTPQEILNEIYKLPFSEQEQIAETVLKHKEASESAKPQISEKEFISYLFDQGIISEFPNEMTDEEFEFEPIEIEGEPMSEQIIRERR